MNTESYVNRYNILTSEFKKMSVSLAEACANIAILELSKDFTYTVSVRATTTINGQVCNTVSVSGTPKIIKTQANYKQSYTNLQIQVSNPPFSIDSWEEVPIL